ncbi:hypothetical protein SmJEL517_g01671 [Synchytrium microbalum]|uniref:Fatty acid hydroxylase domain-containing protein n=1 Tax=Synchytrium microbalum TaxID=1806994 RepID=A0A507CEZ0_9FUNG|nr:uncharacterized protein SmJEL517_g01671 [Synchytrium microbalum]TPX36145.1 hypothetical protein SmJEL517_g01671 [Synchytrium microbalum]
MVASVDTIIGSIRDGLASLETSELSMIFLPIFCYWAYSTLFYVLSILRITSVELHKIPTNQPSRRPPNPTVSAVLTKVAIQHVFQAIVALGIAVVARPSSDAPPRQIEEWYIMIPKIVIAALLLDTYQYWMHRWMHLNRYLYRTIHSVHHELTAPYAFGALYNHPLEGLLMDTVGGAVPSILLDMHPWTSTIFFTVATLKTVDDHCGYTLPWDPFQAMFPNNAAYHDLHHYGKGIRYNFSQPFFNFWDYYCNTDYETEMAKLQQKKKHVEHINGTTEEKKKHVEHINDSKKVGSTSNGNAAGKANGKTNGNGHAYTNGSATATVTVTTPVRRSPRRHK